MLHSLSPTQLIAATIVLSVAYFVRGLAGFGSGLIAIPLLALMLPLTVAVPIVVLLDYLASSSQGIKNREHISWHDILPLLPFSLFGVLMALYLFNEINPTFLGKALGAFIILFALYSLSSFAPSNKHSRIWAGPAGSLGGLIGTLFGTGGPFYVIYLKLRGLEKTNFRATFATIFLLDGAARLCGYLFNGYFNLATMLMVGCSIPIMMIGMYVGGRVHTEITQATFQRTISVLLICSGLALLLK